MRRNATRLGFVIAALASSYLGAQAPPLSSEFQVNTYTIGDQEAPSLAQRSDGSFVVVWQTQNGLNGDDFGIFGQRFDSTGFKVGDEFQVNTYSIGLQEHPRVAAGDQGFVVVWESWEQDGFGEGVFGQRFDATGAKIGPEFQVNSYTTGNQRGPAVAMNSAGDFLVVWESDGEDGDKSGVFGQFFYSAGGKMNGEFRVHAETAGDQLGGTVVVDPRGGFLTLWNGSGPGDDSGVFGRRYDASGAPVGSSFLINTYTTGAQGGPVAAVNARGGFAVAWVAQDGDGVGIFGQLFDEQANRVGPEFPVNTYTTGFQARASVAMDNSGSFVIAWLSQAQDGDGGGLFAQRFDRLASRLGSEFGLNLTTAGRQDLPAIAFRTEQLVAVWESDQGDDHFRIFGRRQSLVPAFASVDAHGGTDTSSDSNGVLEPEERVLFEPGWANRGHFGTFLSGSLSSLSGPSGGIYLVNDGAADYDFIPSKSTGSCNGGAPDECYQLSVGGTRPGTHWDTTVAEDVAGGTKLWTLHVGDSFSDVPRSSSFYKKIETILHAGITSGCAASKFCPGDTVRRDQMAVFLAKGIAGAAPLVPPAGELLGAHFDCSPGGTSLFADVSPSDTSCKHVHYLAAQNVTLGCSVTKFCPTATVTRDAMASFLAKAIVAPGGGEAVPQTYGPDPVTGLSYSCAAGSPNLHFIDVPVSNAFCKHIHYLWAKGIVGGCSATQYCPTQPVNRDAMAKFLANGFGLELYGP